MHDTTASSRVRPRSRESAAILPRGAGLSVKRVDDRVIFADDLPVVYMHNNKAACTSIKYSLLQTILPPERISNAALHWRGEGPFARRLSACGPDEALHVLRRPAFTVVRNPYTRILSAYLNKVMPLPASLQPFCRRYYLEPDPDEGISFIDFLRCIASEHTHSCDDHFAPQYSNTLPHHLTCDFVGSVEDIGATADYLSGHGIPFEPWLNHATGASSLLQRFYTEETAALVRQIFAEDFRIYGYPLELERAQEPPAPGAFAPPRGAALEDFVADPQQCAQPDSPELEALRRFELSRDLAFRKETAARAVAFRDWRVVKALAHAMIGADALDIAARLLDRLVVLRTRHMEHVPEHLLSTQGRALKQKRAEILAHCQQA